MLFDTHCHLAMEDFDKDLDEVVKRAKEANVLNLCVIGTSPSDWEKSISIAERFGFISSLAFSPHDAKFLNNENFEKLKTLAHLDIVKAIGETGLDYHYFISSKEEQKRSFEKHIELAELNSLPLIIHSRESFSDTISILKGVKSKVVIHSFTYGIKEAEEFLKENFFISFSGIVTFKNSSKIQEAAKIVPSDKIFYETDAPYLSPVPHRGKRCEPAFVKETARFLSSIRGEDLKQFEEKSFNNASFFFY
jgi:TatD DNase family protein